MQKPDIILNVRVTKLMKKNLKNEAKANGYESVSELVREAIDQKLGVTKS